MWNFRTGGRTQSPKDAGIKEFAKTPFDSLVRESIQNAIDVRLHNDRPVRVSFELGKINRKEIPGYEELVQRWNASLKKWSDQYGELLTEVVNQLEKYGEAIPYMSITDENTCGMDYTSNEDWDKTRYGAFSRGNHSCHADSNAAGSEGQGKAALYAVTALRAMFVHTVSSHGSLYEGLIRFPTHFFNGQHRYSAELDPPFRTKLTPPYR